MIGDYLHAVDRKRWYRHENPFLLTTVLSIDRNLQNQLFPERADPDFLEKLTELLHSPVASLFEEPLFARANDLLFRERQWLFEYFLLPPKLTKTRGSEGFMMERTLSLLALFNAENHLQLSLIDPSEDFESSYNRLLKLECKLREWLTFAFSPRFGFLTSDFRKVGTALTLKLCLHLPVLVRRNGRKYMEEVSRKYHMQLAETTNETILVFENISGPNIREETILKNGRKLLLDLTSTEKKEREKKEIAFFKDSAGKAFGILRHALRLDEDEALEQVSLCKLAAEMNWLQGVPPEEMNTLLFTLSDGHLLLSQPGGDTEKIPEMRALRIREALTNASLRI